MVPKLISFVRKTVHRAFERLLDLSKERCFNYAIAWLGSIIMKTMMKTFNIFEQIIYAIISNSIIMNYFNVISV